MQTFSYSLIMYDEILKNVLNYSEMTFNNRNLFSYILISVLLIMMGFVYFEYSKKKSKNNKSLNMVNEKIQKLQEDMPEKNSHASNLKDNIVTTIKQSDIDITMRNFAQSQSFKNILNKYIEENPEIIIKSLEQYYQKKTTDEKESRIQSFVNSMLSKDQRYTPIIKGSDNQKDYIIIFEFFDYNCSFCKTASELNAKILTNFPNAIIVFKEIPIMGQKSFEISRVSLAVYQISPGLYFKFQNEIFQNKALKNMDNASVRKHLVNLAGTVGVDKNALTKWLSNNKNIAMIDSIMRSNLDEAKELNVRGTPAYVIGDKTLIEGLPNYENVADLMNKINEQNNKNTNNNQNNTDNTNVPNFANDSSNINQANTKNINTNLNSDAVNNNTQKIVKANNDAVFSTINNVIIENNDNNNNIANQANQNINVQNQQQSLNLKNTGNITSNNPNIQNQNTVNNTNQQNSTNKVNSIADKPQNNNQTNSMTNQNQQQNMQNTNATNSNDTLNNINNVISNQQQTNSILQNAKTSNL